MNKSQLMTLLVALLVTALGWIIAVSCGHQRSYLRVRTIGIGNDLIVRTNSDRLVLIGPSLRSRLEQLLSSPTKLETVKLGDEAAPFGDGKATSHLILKNQKGERLGIRLRREDGDKFDVLGYWTPDVLKESLSHRVEKIPLH